METKKKMTYIEAVGRRKTSTARVRLTPGPKMHIVVNDKDAKIYFPTKEMTYLLNDIFEKAKIEQTFDISVNVKGGGIHSQIEAVRHGIARTLVMLDESLKDNIKKAGFLKRDPRMKERRKFGLKKARKAPQWSKR